MPQKVRMQDLLSVRLIRSSWRLARVLDYIRGIASVMLDTAGWLATLLHYARFPREPNARDMKVTQPAHQPLLCQKYDDVGDPPCYHVCRISLFE